MREIQSEVSLITSLWRKDWYCCSQREVLTINTKLRNCYSIVSILYTHLSLKRCLSCEQTSFYIFRFLPTCLLCWSSLDCPHARTSHSLIRSQSGTGDSFPPDRNGALFFDRPCHVTEERRERERGTHEKCIEKCRRRWNEREREMGLRNCVDIEAIFCPFACLIHANIGMWSFTWEICIRVMLQDVGASLQLYFCEV